MADYLDHSERHRNHRQPRDRRVDHDPATGVNAGPPSDRDGAGDAPDEAKGVSTPAPVAVHPPPCAGPACGGECMAATCDHSWLDRPESDSRECLICGEEVFG